MMEEHILQEEISFSCKQFFPFYRWILRFTVAEGTPHSSGGGYGTLPSDAPRRKQLTSIILL